MVKSDFLRQEKTIQKSARIVWWRMIWRVDWRKKIDSIMKNKTCERFWRRGTRSFWRPHRRTSTRSRFGFRKLIITYSDSEFHAEQEYVFLKLNRLYLGSKNCILLKIAEKLRFSETESISGFSDLRQHLEKF